MTLKDIAKQLTTAVQTVPNLVQILRDGLEQATAGSTVEVTQVVSSGTKIASVKVDNATTDLYAPSAAHDYSATEHVVGKWTDGTPIYEITLSSATLTDASARTWGEIATLTDNSIDKIIKIDGTVVCAGVQYNLNYNDTLTYFVPAYDEATHKLNACYNTQGNGNATVIATIQYTKSAS